jgi:transcription elongation factor GreB
MNKAFVKETDADEDDDEQNVNPSVPSGFKNYIRPSGLQRLKDELVHLLDIDRPEVVKIVSWAASNGDRSENGDYLYGKKRLREIDRRIRFLTKKIDSAVPVDPAGREGLDQIFFGATVTYEQSDGVERQVTIVGVDEVAPEAGLISWISPVAGVLMKARTGDVVTLRAPQGILQLEVLDVHYKNNQ